MSNVAIYYDIGFQSLYSGLYVRACVFSTQASLVVEIKWLVHHIGDEVSIIGSDVNMDSTHVNACKIPCIGCQKKFGKNKRVSSWLTCVAFKCSPKINCLTFTTLYW
jgi:hypothetical protein